MEKAQEKQMKNIEEINKASVKKILTTKKIPEFFAGDTIKAVSYTHLTLPTKA